MGYWGGEELWVVTGPDGGLLQWEDQVASAPLLFRMRADAQRAADMNGRKTGEQLFVREVDVRIITREK